MQAIILAAGMGRRLGELTRYDTKCMIEVNGIRIIDRLLANLEIAGLSRIVLVIGFQGDKLRAYLGNEYCGIPIYYLENPYYAHTNNIYSLFLARHHLASDDTLLLESDIVFEKRILERVLEEPYPDVAVVDRYKSWMDGTMVTVDEKQFIVDFVSKHTFSYEEKGGLRGILNILEINAPLSEYARPGGWNDPDMLVVGIGGKSKSIGYESEGCTNEQYQSHFALWCMMASPLLCGNDVRQMNDSTLQILLNKDLIAIDQDPLGIQAERAIRADHYDVWVKPLSDGSKAIACLNRISGPVDVELNVKTVEGLSLDRVYDVIEGSLVAEASTGWVVKLAPGECKVFICK